jgi:hypothetical protein
VQLSCLSRVSFPPAHTREVASKAGPNSTPRRPRTFDAPASFPCGHFPSRATRRNSISTPVAVHPVLPLNTACHTSLVSCALVHTRQSARQHPQQRQQQQQRRQEEEEELPTRRESRSSRTSTTLSSHREALGSWERLVLRLVASTHSTRETTSTLVGSASLSLARLLPPTHWLNLFLFLAPFLSHNISPHLCLSHLSHAAHHSKHPEPKTPNSVI